MGFLGQPYDHSAFNTVTNDGKPCVWCEKDIPIIKVQKKTAYEIDRSNRVDCDRQVLTYGQGKMKHRWRTESYHLECYKEACKRYERKGR